MKTQSGYYPKITIVTPSFNQGEYIEDTILSVITQDYPNFEYIVIDGGSSDNTIEILNKYSDHINFWISEKDKGQADAINKGFRMSTGEIVNWINSDDQLMPKALSKVAQRFAEHPDAIMIHGRIEYFGEVKHNFFSRNLSLRDIGCKYVAHICMPQPATFYRKRLLEEQGLLDESLRFSMDTDLFVRTGLHYKIVQTEDVLARFRLHASSKSVSSFNKNFLEENAIIFSRVLKTLGNENAIKKMDSIGLYTEPMVLYNKPAKKFDTQKLIFHFISHRLYTLYYHQDKKEFKRLFNFLARNFTSNLLISVKLLIYRASLFLPQGFLHSLLKKKK